MTTKKTRKVVKRARDLCSELEQLAGELAPRAEADHVVMYVDNVRTMFARCLYPDPDARRRDADRR